VQPDVTGRLHDTRAKGRDLAPARPYEYQSVDGSTVDPATGQETHVVSYCQLFKIQ